MSSHADVVKKSYLKLKVSKSSSSSAVQGVSHLVYLTSTLYMR